MHGDAALPLLTIDENLRVTVATAESPLDAKPGVTLVALVRENEPAT